MRAPEEELLHSVPNQQENKMTDLLNISESLTHNSFEISLPCFHRMENIEPERRENTRQINTPIVSHFPFVAGCKDCSWCFHRM